MLTCRERAGVRATTLASWARTDWGKAPAVYENESAAPEPIARLNAGFSALLRRALATGADYLLLLEDDLRFNRHLRANLAAWPPLRDRRLHFASLYNPGVPALERCPAERHFLADPARAIGAQVRILSRAFATALLPHLREDDAEIHDLHAARLCHELGFGPLFYHTPSLVQHTGPVSLWAGPAHHAPDFEETWRAPVA